MKFIKSISYSIAAFALVANAYAGPGSMITAPGAKAIEPAKVLEARGIIEKSASGLDIEARQNLTRAVEKELGLGKNFDEAFRSGAEQVLGKGSTRVEELMKSMVVNKNFKAGDLYSGEAEATGQSLLSSCEIRGKSANSSQLSSTLDVAFTAEAKPLIDKLVAAREASERAMGSSEAVIQAAKQQALAIGRKSVRDDKSLTLTNGEIYIQGLVAEAAKSCGGTSCAYEIANQKLAPVICKGASSCADFNSWKDEGCIYAF